MDDKRKPVSIEGLAIPNMYSQEALVRLLVHKGIITKEEYLNEIRKVQEQEQERRKRNGLK